MSAPAATPKYKLWIVIEDAQLAASPEAGGPDYYDFHKRVDYDNLNAGFDLLTAADYSGCGPALVSLGVRAMMTRMDTGETVHYWLAPRSSIYKTGYMMANSMGVIDRSYRGILMAPVVYVAGAEATASHLLQKGHRHFQILAPDMGHIVEIERVEELPATARGDGGFGSTGR